jgi:hypothetical protein
VGEGRGDASHAGQKVAENQQRLPAYPVNHGEGELKIGKGWLQELGLAYEQLIVVPDYHKVGIS